MQGSRLTLLGWMALGMLLGCEVEEDYAFQPGSAGGGQAGAGAGGSADDGGRGGASGSTSSAGTSATGGVTAGGGNAGAPSSNGGTPSTLGTGGSGNAGASSETAGTDGGADPCDPNPCVNGQCDADRDPLCECDPDFEGPLCDQQVNDCAPMPCLNGGTCVDGPNRYACQCVGFSGPNCELVAESCADEPCLNDGTCMDLEEGFECQCADGYDGDNCAIDIDECEGDPCLNDGICTDAVNGFSCACDGYEGPTCADDIDECADDPCVNGQCVNLDGGYRCDCPDTWTGDNCEIDRNECTLGIGECENGGTCINVDGGYECSCTSRYNGTFCEFLKFRGIGKLAGHTTSDAQDVSGDGTIVIGNSNGPSGKVGVRLVGNGTIESLGLPTMPAATNCEAVSTNRIGSIVVGTCNSGAFSFQYLPGSGIDELDVWPLTPQPSPDVEAQQVSPDGSVVVGFWNDPENFVSRPFRRADGVSELLGVLAEDEFMQVAVAANEDGSVVVGYSDTGELPWRLWRWTEGSDDLVPLELPANTSFATVMDISADGNVIVGGVERDGGATSNAARWVGPDAEIELLDGAVMYSTNADGSVSVGYVHGTDAAIWDAEGNVATLAEVLGDTPDLATWSISTAMAVSDDGHIVVGGGFRNTSSEGWIAHLP